MTSTFTMQGLRGRGLADRPSCLWPLGTGVLMIQALAHSDTFNIEIHNCACLGFQYSETSTCSDQCGVESATSFPLALVDVWSNDNMALLQAYLLKQDVLDLNPLTVEIVAATVYDEARRLDQAALLDERRRTH